MSARITGSSAPRAVSVIRPLRMLSCGQTCQRSGHQGQADNRCALPPHAPYRREIVGIDQQYQRGKPGDNDRQQDHQRCQYSSHGTLSNTPLTLSILSIRLATAPCWSRYLASSRRLYAGPPGPITVQSSARRWASPGVAPAAAAGVVKLKHDAAGPAGSIRCAVTCTISPRASGASVQPTRRQAG